MTGYVRKDTTNNIADGNVINAADLDAEFDGVQDAFNASTGHKHDGTAGEGATINALGPTQDVTISSTLLAPKTTNTVDIGSSSLKFKDLFLAGNASVGGTLAVTGVATLTAQPILSSLTASRAVFTDGSKGLVSNAITGTGNVVMSASPTLTGTAGFENITASGTLGVTGVATFTAQPIVSSLTASRAVFSDGSKGLVSNAITGTGNVVMSASPTLTGTIAAEALTASGAVTLSGGTANGVTYLNGSKVLTSGSALTFNGSNTFTVVPATGTAYNRTESAQYSTWLQTGAGNANVFWEFSAGTPVRWVDTSAGELMRLTSTGLGIGTSSPAAKLHVIGDQIRHSNSSNASYYGTFYHDAASTGANIYNSQDTGGHLFQNSGSTVLTLSNAGNLGLGVTPSAWASGYKVLEMQSGGNSVVSFGASDIALTSGGYYNGGWKYGATNSLGANAFELYNGTFIWYQKTAVAHTAGDAFTMTQAMTLDASGNLGVGTTSPAYKINVVEGKTLTPTTGDGQIAIDNSTSGQVSAILFSSQGTRRAQISAGLGGTGNDGYLAFTTRNDTTGFGERARIDSSGNLLVGKTSTAIGTAGVVITYYGAVTFSTATADYSIFNKTTTNTGKQIEFRSADTAVGYIESTSTATSYNTSSDYRLKNTIAPMTGALAKVAQLKPVTYKWNADGSDGEGFIAHELAEVCPHAVSGEKDAVDEEGNPKYQGIDTSFLVATLTAALQEQQAIIESLKARLDAANL